MTGICKEEELPEEREVKSYGTENRVSFVGQSQYHIRITPAQFTEFFDKTDAIKNVAGIDEESTGI